MRSRKQERSLSVHAVAGTYVVLLGLDIAEDKSKGLLGFTIIRETEGEPGKKILGGGKRFASVPDDGKPVRSDKAPIQSFLWGDYEALPGKTYRYRVIAQYGQPGKLKAGDEVTVPEGSFVTPEQALQAIEDFCRDPRIASPRLRWVRTRDLDYPDVL